MNLGKSMGSVSSSVRRLSWHIPPYMAVLDALGESSGESKTLGSMLSVAYNVAAAVVGDGVSLMTGIAYKEDELEYTGECLNVPGYCQIESYTCGFMAGLIVLHTFKPNADSTDFFYTVDPCRVMGTTTEELKGSLGAWDIGVDEYDNLDIDEICLHIDDGYPVITTLNVYPGMDHWVVIYGYDGNELLLANNNHNRLTRKEFRRQWPEKGFGLVCWGK